MIIFSHPTGNANVREATCALNDAGLLTEFWTSVSWRQSHPLNALLPNSIRQQLNRRAFPRLPQNRVRCNPWRETVRLLAARFRLSNLIRHEVGRFSVDTVYKSLDRKVANRLHRDASALAVYGYEDGAVETFRAARELGIRTIYELPIGYWRPLRKLMKEEAELHPEWESTSPGNTDSSEKHLRKDEELALADHIIVPSAFVRSTLSDADQINGTINLVPYGAPFAGGLTNKPQRTDGKLRVIFVGSLSQRKGISYLFRAAEILGDKIELTVIGKPFGECEALNAALKKHRWVPSLSHDEVLEEMRMHDVMVFPSLFEGFGLVILEAMSCGIPVITTPNGAAPDVITDGEDGFIVPIRDAEAIAGKLEMWMGDRARLVAMGQAAMRKAAQHSWEHYREHLVSTLRSLLTTDTATHMGKLDPDQLEMCNS